MKVLVLHCRECGLDWFRWAPGGWGYGWGYLPMEQRPHDDLVTCPGCMDALVGKQP